MTTFERLAQRESQEVYGSDRYNVSRMVEGLNRSTRLDVALRNPTTVQATPVRKKNKEL